MLATSVQHSGAGAYLSVDCGRCAGISDMRNALEEKVQERLKNKGKQRMRPKMGKMDIDYSILHDAFFKYQDKPKMAKIGELYHEGVPAVMVTVPVWCRSAHLRLVRAR